MTPLAENLLPSSGDCSETVISLHSVKGWGLRNSMPLLWMETVSADNSSFACRATTVMDFSNEPPPTNFFALIYLNQAITLPAAVKLEEPLVIISHHSMTAAPQVKPAPNTTSKI